MPEVDWNPNELRRRMRAHGETVYLHTRNSIAQAMMIERRNYAAQTEEKFIEPDFHQEMME